MMENPSIKYGLYIGLANAVITLLAYFINPEWMFGFTLQIALIIFNIVLMVMAVNEYRDANEGYILFKEGFKAAWLTFIIGVTIVNIFSYLLYNYIDPGLIDVAKEKTMEAIEKMGSFMGEDAMEASLEEIANSNPFGLPKVLLGILISFIFPGAVLAAIIAAVKVRKRSEFS